MSDGVGRDSGWVQTHTGRKFHFKREWWESDDIDIEDIATALSRAPRYCGHTDVFYSVAQHCVLVCLEVAIKGGSLRDQLIGLLHDAPEAYMGDLPSPLKAMCPEYKAIEDGVWDRVSHAFLGGVYKIPPVVKQCDLALLTAEAEDCFDFEPIDNWVKYYASRAKTKVFPLDSKAAYNSYLGHFERLQRLCESERVKAAEVIFG